MKDEFVGEKFMKDVDDVVKADPYNPLIENDENDENEKDDE